jgi:hypothetical protein
MALHVKTMNKKGTSLASWLEAGLGIVLLLTLVGLLIANMNSDYGQTHDPTFGMQSNSTKQQFIDYQSTIDKGMQGEATTSALTGISLGTSWSMAKAGLGIAFGVVTGSWIQNAVGLLNWGEAGMALGLILRLLFVVSIGLVLLRLILKINP